MSVRHMKCMQSEIGPVCASPSEVMCPGGKCVVSPISCFEEEKPCAPTSCMGAVQECKVRAFGNTIQGLCLLSAGVCSCAVQDCKNFGLSRNMECREATPNLFACDNTTEDVYDFRDKDRSCCCKRKAPIKSGP